MLGKCSKINKLCKTRKLKDSKLIPCCLLSSAVWLLRQSMELVTTHLWQNRVDHSLLAIFLDTFFKEMIIWTDREVLTKWTTSLARLLKTSRVPQKAWSYISKGHRALLVGYPELLWTPHQKSKKFTLQMTRSISRNRAQTFWIYSRKLKNKRSSVRWVGCNP